MSEQPHTAILFVCLGNICRSPLAEGSFRAAIAERGLQEAFRVDSAGLGDWHAGSPPDRRSIAIARQHGFDIGGLKARQIDRDDFARFDLILAMDSSNIAELKKRAPQPAHGRIDLLLQHALGRAEDVPDPYYGADEGFAEIYRTIRAACEALAEKLSARADSA